MWYNKEKNERGDYLSANGERHALYTADDIICPPGQTPEENGWFFFNSEEACLAAWGLHYEPYVPPRNGEGRAVCECPVNI